MFLPLTKIGTQALQRKGKCILKPQLQAKEKRSAPKFNYKLHVQKQLTYENLQRIQWIEQYIVSRRVIIIHMSNSLYRYILWISVMNIIWSSCQSVRYLHISHFNTFCLDFFWFIFSYNKTRQEYCHLSNR